MGGGVFGLRFDNLDNLASFFFGHFFLTELAYVYLLGVEDGGFRFAVYCVVGIWVLLWKNGCEMYLLKVMKMGGVEQKTRFFAESS